MFLSDYILICLYFTQPHGMASSSFLDSEATFAQQAKEAGLSDEWIESLKANAVATFAKLSFSITSPGTVATDDQINRFLGQMRHGVAPSISDMAAFKRILFESQTLMMHSFSLDVSMPLKPLVSLFAS